MCAVLESRLTAWGLDVRTAENLAAAERELVRFRPSVVVSDVQLPDGSGVDILDRLAEGVLEAPVVLITAHGTIDLAVEAMRRGALDFLTKPIDYDRLRRSIEAALAAVRSRERTREASAESTGQGGLGELVGVSKAMREIFAVISEIAPTDASVLLTGESGTGKELAARTIHRLSRRRDGEFVAINTAAIPAELMESEVFGHEKGAFTGAVGKRRGCFELSDGGTLFLDEIAEMPMALQPKLLRVLEDGRVRRLGSAREIEVDARLVSATNRPPAEAVDEKLLREDLYYRLNVFEIELPPLRQRLSDLPPLIDHFITRLNREHGAAVERPTDEALAALRGHSWPGNVRELRNVLERAVVLTREGQIEAGHLSSLAAAPEGAVETPTAGMTIAEAERELILRTLDETGNNKSEAARRLGIDVKTVRNKLHAWGIER